MDGKHEADPIGSAARESTASPYAGKHRGQGRTLEFHFGALTHHHMLSMAQAEANLMIGAGSVHQAVKATQQEKATGMDLRKPGVPVKLKNKPARGREIEN